jgi:hypothetical protein
MTETDRPLRTVALVNQVPYQEVMPFLVDGLREHAAG